MITFDELKERSVWCLYKLAPRPNGKLAKIPHSAITREAFDTHHTPLLTDGATAAAVYRSGGFDGIGIVLPSDLTVIDIDGAFQGGRLRDIPRQIVQMFDGTFIERSVSGNGLHVFCQAHAPQVTNDAENGLEIFGRGAFIAMTFHAYGAAGLPVIEGQAIIDALLVIPDQTAPETRQNRPVRSVSGQKGNQKGGIIEADIVGALQSIYGGIAYRDWVGVVAGMVNDLGVRRTNDLINRYNWQRTIKTGGGPMTEVERIAHDIERRGSRATLGKLYHMARQNGYTGPWRVERHALAGV